MKPNINKAKRHLKKLRENIAKRKSPFSSMKEEAVIREIRKVREQIWREKIAHRP